MSLFLEFIQTNIKWIVNIWVFVLYVINEHLKYEAPLVSIIFSVLSILIFHYIKLIEENKTVIEKELFELRAQIDDKAKEEKEKVEEVKEKEESIDL